MPERTNYEIINNGQVTPQRLHALLRLVARRRRPGREDLLTLLQPPELSDNTKAAAAVFAAAVRAQLITYDQSEDIVTFAPGVARDGIESVASFRALLQRRLCGITDPDQDNYLLNQVVAWYAVQLPEVYTLKKPALAAKFNQELYPREPEAGAETGRAINETKLTTWYAWVSFLGWGLIAGDTLWPVAHLRLQPQLAGLQGRTLRMSEFIEHLSSICPEMDGGVLYEQCWSASRPGQPRGQQLSFMLSTALGTLHGLKKIKMEYSADSLDRWHIYPSATYPSAEATYITVLEH